MKAEAKLLKIQQKRAQAKALKAQLLRESDMKRIATSKINHDKHSQYMGLLRRFARNIMLTHREA